MDTIIGMTILIVDDDENMAAMMRVCLQRGGFHILEANNGADALRLVEQYTPQLVVADVMMPDMVGYELLRQIRLRAKTPVLMVTGAGISRRPLTLDNVEQQVACDGNTLKLSRSEFQLLSAFMERPRHVFTREEPFKSVNANERLRLLSS